MSQNFRKVVDGVFLLDKPEGLTSNDALIRIKRSLNAKKAGHTGTLDPFATGLLPLCFGEATKFSHDLLNADKTYEATLILGQKTTTGDVEGEVIQTKSIDGITKESVQQVMPQFIGEIFQTPPMYSALKRGGKPLYEYAREGITVEREKRVVTIHELSIEEIVFPFVKIQINCSKGTYIRTLGEDIGDALGCGAHLKTLRRTKVGDLSIEDAVSFLKAEENPSVYLKPVDYLLKSFPAINLDEILSFRFSHGQRISLEKEALPYERIGRVRVYHENQLLGTAIIREDGILAPERLTVKKNA